MENDVGLCGEADCSAAGQGMAEQDLCAGKRTNISLSPPPKSKCGLGSLLSGPLFSQTKLFDSDWGTRLFDMLRRRWLVPAPTGRAQIGWNMALKVVMFFFFVAAGWRLHSNYVSRSCAKKG